MKLTLLVASLLVLAACERETGADNQVLCRPDTLEAYYSKPGGGDISFIRRSKSADLLCRAALSQGGGK